MRGNKTLIQQSSFTIYPKHKVGLVGRNGCGKSSLFASLLGQLAIDAGQLTMPSNWHMATVKQETPALEQSALDYVMDGDAEFRQIEAKLKQAEAEQNGTEQAHLLHQLEVIHGYSLPARAAELLHGLGFSQAQLGYAVKDFSGGWRMRLNLAQALISRADLMLLDEPTNHLDLDAVIWLQRYLKQYDGTLVLISHDRDFLDAVVGEILHIEQQTIRLYSGNYSAFERQRAEQLAQQAAQYQKQQREVAHLTAFVDRFRAKASKAKQAQSRLKRLQKLPELAPAHVDSEFSFRFDSPSYMPYPLLSLTDSNLGYSTNAILSEVKLSLVPGARIGLLGRNGAGKSTLIKSLQGELALISGERFAAQELEVGYFCQHQLEQLTDGHNAVEHILQADKSFTDQSARNFLGNFGFSGDQALSDIKLMSGGEKARLVLALIALKKPHVLLLDEPTNHLDLEMRQSLVLALQEFDGAIILIAHDRFLLESCVDEYYLVHDGKVEPFNGDIDDYQQLLQQDKKQQQVEQKPNTSSDNVNSGNSAIDKKQQRQQQAKLRQQVAPLRKQAQKYEKLVEQQQAELDAIEQQLSVSEIYQAEHKAKLTDLLQQQAKVKQSLEQNEMQWLELEAEIEEMMQAE